MKKIIEKLKKFEKSINKSDRKKLYILVFLLRFLVLAVPLYWFMESSISIYYYELFQTHQVKFILDAFSVNSSIGKTYSLENALLTPTIETSDYIIGIDRACTGYRSMFALFSLILALPKIKWSKRLKGIFFGFAVLYLSNIIRISTTILLGLKYGEAVFNFAHTVLWREGLIILVLILWVLWIKLMVKKIDYNVWI